MTRRRPQIALALCVSVVVAAACSCSGDDEVDSAVPPTAQQEAADGDETDDAIVSPTSTEPSPTTTVTTPTVTTPTVTSAPDTVSDTELSVGLLLSDFGFGELVGAPIGVAAGKADQDVQQLGLPFHPRGGEYSTLFLISANGDLAEDPAVLTASFAELIDAQADILIGPNPGGDLSVLTELAADAAVPFAIPGYVNDGTIPTLGIRFDMAGSLDTQLDLIVRKVAAGEFDSIVVLGSPDDDIGRRLDDMFARAGTSASLALMPADGDVDDVQRLAAELAGRGDRVAMVMATDVNAAPMIEAMLAEPGGDNTAFFGGDFSLSRSTVGSIQGLGRDQVIVVRRANDVSRPEQAEFLSRMQENNPELVRPFDAAEAYDFSVLAALATVEGADASRSNIRVRLIDLSRDGEPCDNPADCVALIESGVDIDYDGVSGPIELDDDGVSTATWFAIDIADPSTGELVTDEFVLHSL